MSALNALNSIRIHKALTKIMKNSQYGSIEFKKIDLQLKWFEKLGKNRIDNIKSSVLRIHESIKKDPLQWVTLPKVTYPSGLLENVCSAQIEIDSNKKLLFFSSFTMLDIHVDPYLTDLSKCVMYLSIDFLSDIVNCNVVDNKFLPFAEDVVSELKKFNLIK